MNKEQFISEVLKEAKDWALTQFPGSIEYNDKFGNRSNSSEAFFFPQLAEKFAQNGILTQDDSVSAERRNTARASAFAISVLNSVYMTEQMHDGIDDYFSDPSKLSSGFLLGKSQEEIQALRDEIKNQVTDTLAVEARTPAGKDFVEKVTSSYNKITQYKYNPDWKGVLEKENFFEEHSIEALGDTLGAIYELNDHLTLDLSLTEALDRTKASQTKNNTYQTILFDALKNDVAALASEEEIYAQTVRNMDIRLDGNETVKPKDFVDHFRNGQLTGEDVLWAKNVFESGMNGEEMDFSKVMLDGKPMFSKEQIDNSLAGDLKVAIVAEALSGKEVTVKDHQNEKLTLLNPRITETSEKTNRSFWQKVADLFMSLFSKSKTAEKDTMKENISNTLNDFNNKKKAREKISFDELSGRTTLRKINTAPSCQNDLSKSKNGPSRGV